MATKKRAAKTPEGVVVLERFTSLDGYRSQLIYDAEEDRIVVAWDGGRDEMELDDQHWFDHKIPEFKP
jgi:hypothetical protein